MACAEFLQPFGPEFFIEGEVPGHPGLSFYNSQVKPIHETQIMLTKIAQIARATRAPVFFISTILFLLSIAQPLAAQDKPAKLFTSDDTMNLTLTASWRTIERDKKNQEPYPATLKYTDELGKTHTLEMTVERRGITRQKVCDFPPIKLRFKKETVKGTTFRGQKSLKMVTHCEKSSRFEQYYLLEMLSYKMYNLINDYSFRVRPLNVTYIDPDSNKTYSDRFAFLIEDDSDVAKRNDLKKLKIPKIRVSQLEPGITSEFSLFQYMIGNVDWAALSGPDPTECCHNVKLIGPEPFGAKDIAYPVPYDFDSSGLVDAHYAAPPNGLPIRRVTQRLFRGYCIDNSTLEDARKKILSHEAAFYSLIRDEDRLSSGSQNKSTRFLDKFFKIIKDPKDFDRLVTSKCRK